MFRIVKSHLLKANTRHFATVSVSSGFTLRLRHEHKSFLKISNMPRRSSDSFIYTGNVTVTPCSLITWTTGGEFYHNQIAEGLNKEIFMLDTKLTFNVSRRIEISASATNLFNKKEYGYTSYSTVSQYERSSKLRGREFMISIYLKK